MWIVPSLLLAFGLVSLLLTYLFRAVLVHGEPVSFCMSRQPSDPALSGDVLVRWDAPLLPFGIECEYVSSTASVVEFHDFGTAPFAAGLIAIALAVAGLAAAILRARSRSTE